MYSLVNAAELSGIYVRLLVRTQICVQRYNFFLIYASFFTILNEILHFMSKKQQHSAFPILQDWRIRGGNAECRRGGGREPALDAGTKNKERGRGDGAGDDIARSIWKGAILSGR